MIHLRHSLANSSIQLTEKLKKLPYSILFFLIQTWVTDLKTNIWLRNSFALNYWTFGLSDLDLSIWVDGGMNESMKAWKKIKSINWLLLGGEVQIYSSQQIFNFIEYANCWEIRRDPRLLERINYNPKLNNEMELTVFLVRSLLADKNLRIDPDFRQRKWLEHLKAFGISNIPQKVTWEWLLDLLHARPPFSLFSRKELKDALLIESYLPQQANEVERLIFSNHHVWQGEWFDKDLILLNRNEKSIHEFLYYQISWEVWGLYPFTLFSYGFSKEQIEGHVSNQIKLTKLLKITPHDQEKLVHGLSKLSECFLKFNTV